jgi:hypothetical protein
MLGPRSLFFWSNKGVLHPALMENLVTLKMIRFVLFVLTSVLHV